MKGSTSKVLSETVSIRAAEVDGGRTGRGLNDDASVPRRRCRTACSTWPSNVLPWQVENDVSADVSTPLHVEGDRNHAVSGRQETSPHVEI